MNFFSIFAQGLLVAATATLLVSLIQVRQLIASCQRESLRSKWSQLSMLILVFITSYIIYAAFFWLTFLGSHDLIVPAVFFIGACFVWLTTRLAYQTTQDVSRLIKLELENITDPLIGIYNRRHLDRRLEEELNRALRYKMPLSFLMVDIDHFKRVNDTHGHQIGDLALIHLGKILMDNVRSLDVVARFGGEELAIIAPDTPTMTAADLAKRLNQQVEINPLKFTDKNGNLQDIKLTISIGVASLNNRTDSPKKLLQNADEALYQAKQNGRNQVVVSGTDLAV